MLLPATNTYRRRMDSTNQRINDDQQKSNSAFLFDDNPNTGRYANQYRDLPYRRPSSYANNIDGLRNNELLNNFNPYRPFSSSGFDPLKLLQQPINMFQQFQQQFRQNRPDQNLKPEEEGQQPPSISEFARFGNNARKNGLFSGGAFSSTFGSGNGNPPLFQSTSIHMDGDGKVTTVESGSGMEDKVTTGRIGGSFGGGNGVFAATGTKVEPNGIISSFRHVGPLQ